MTTENEALRGSLSLCRKAGKLLYGYDRVADAVMQGKAKLVLLACDASERTATHMAQTCEGFVPCLQMPLSTQELAFLSPKPAAVFAVADEHLAQLCKSRISQNKEDTAHGL